MKNENEVVKFPVLIADDDDSTRSGLAQYLDQFSFQIMAVGDGLEAWNFIQSRDEPLFVILDWDMPHMTGVEVLQEIKQLSQRDPGRFIYSLLMTGKFIAPGEIATGIISGARGVLKKPLEIIEVFGHICAAEMALKGAIFRQEALQKDSLTGLYSQAQGFEQLEKELSRSRRTGSSVAFFLIDLDKFKSINDTYGHVVGSEVLKIVANRLEDLKRDYDIAIRYGGDEFAMILPEITESEARLKAERICNTLSKHPVIFGGHKIPVTLSLGVAVSSKKTPLSSREIVERADRALYMVKDRGRNGFAIFEE